MPFKKGQSGNPSGQHGPQKIPQAVKEMIEGALSDVGGRSYLAAQAVENPSAFMSLLGRIIPKDINASVTGQIDLRAFLQSLGEPK